MKIAAHLTYELKYDDDLGKMTQLKSISVMQDVPKGHYVIREHEVVNKNHGLITKIIVLAN